MLKVVKVARMLCLIIMHVDENVKIFTLFYAAFMIAFLHAHAAVHSESSGNRRGNELVCTPLFPLFYFSLLLSY